MVSTETIQLYVNVFFNDDTQSLTMKTLKPELIQNLSMNVMLALRMRKTNSLLNDLALFLVFGFGDLW